MRKISRSDLGIRVWVRSSLFFLAAALALSAIPVLAKVLADRGMTRSAFGQAVLAAGMIDDIIGWTCWGSSLHWLPPAESTQQTSGLVQSGWDPVI